MCRPWLTFPISHFLTRKEAILPDFPALTVCLSLAVLILVFSFVRERRIRNALQFLLSRFLAQRRPKADETDDSSALPRDDDRLQQ